MDKVPTENKEGSFHSFSISKVGKQSDNFITFLSELWQIPSKRKLTHKNVVYGRVHNFIGDSDFTIDKVYDFQFHFTTKEDLAMSPSIQIHIDWNN